MRILLFMLILLAPLPALAGMAEAKDLAKSMNCTIKNIVVASKTSGENPTTTYKVDCDIPATASAEEKKNNSTLLIKCEAALCGLLKQGE